MFMHKKEDSFYLNKFEEKFPHINPRSTKSYNWFQETLTYYI